MLIEPEVKQYLIDYLDLDRGASDRVASAFLNAKMASGEMTVDEWLAIERPLPEDRKQFIAWASEHRDMPSDTDGETILQYIRAAKEDGSYQKHLASLRTTSTEGNESMSTESTVSQQNQSNKPIASKMMSGAPSLKAASSHYKSTRDQAKNKAGQPLYYRGSPVEQFSELQYAKLGAFVKFIALRSNLNQYGLNDHEKALLHEMAEHELFVTEATETAAGKTIDGSFLKQALTGSASGVQYATPAWLDEHLVIAPLLTSELAPFVDTQDIDSNATMGAAAGVPSVHWDQAVEGSPLTLEDFSGFVQAFNTTCHTVTSLAEVGLDALADSPMALGQAVIGQINLKIGNDLDRVIAVGNGTTEPEGFFTAAGSTSVNSTLGPSGPFTVGDLERLMFALPKQYRNKSRNCAFVSNDATYIRIRGIPRGSDDAQRVFGMDHGSYSVFDWPYRICNGVPDGKIGFVALRDYRLYRRAGATIRYTQEGENCIKKNTGIFAVRARYAGKLSLGASTAVMSDGATFDNG